MASDAVGQERISQVVGYKITKGNFNENTPNLPQRVVIIGEANDANQAGLVLEETEILSAQQAGQLYGFGSPLYLAMRILRPLNGGGLGGIPTFVIPQEAAVGATAKVLELTPTGVATGNGTHTVVLNGRTGLDSVFYNFSVVSGDTTADITAKIEDAINNVLGAPVIAAATDYEVTLTSKWKGLTSNDLNISIETNGNDLGITYATNVNAAGSGTPTIPSDLLGTEWTTIVLNTYGTVTAVMDSLESINGIPDPTNPTGRFASIVMKPFIALTGSVSTDPSAITDARLNDVTIALCTAFGSTGFPFEAAANMCSLFARQANDNPHLDVSGMSYPDMPVPTTLGTSGTYDFRDSIVKKGCSTVDLVAGKFKIMDFVTTYHPVGETPPQFRYCRSLVIDFNMRFGYFLLEQINVVDHAIAANEDITFASKVVKPNQWKSILFGYADDLAKRSLIADTAFMKESIVVNLSTVNPDRFETFFKYKRSGFIRIASTTAEAGFNFGSN